MLLVRRLTKLSVIYRFRKGIMLFARVGCKCNFVDVCFHIWHVLLVTFFCFFICYMSAIESKQTNAASTNDGVLQWKEEIVFQNNALRPRSIIAAPDERICRNIKYLVMVLTKYNDYDTRQLWRKFYGEPMLMEKNRYRLLFLIGVRPGSENRTVVEEEIRTYGDVLQAGYLDSYRNLVHKTLSGMRYFATACHNVRALVKIDDDVAWNVTKVSSFIDNNVIPCVIYCHRWDNNFAIRVAKSKVYATKSEWPQYYYPKYCSGVGYIAHRCAISRMLDAVPQSEFFWVDDIFTTGVLTKNSNVSLYDITNAVEIFKENATKLDPGTMFHMTKQANVAFPFISR